MNAPYPVFLPGAARSGTTLLYKALCLHPEVAWISNWVGRSPGRPGLAMLNRLAGLRPAMRQRVWFGREGANAYVYGRRRARWERAFPMPVEGEPLYGHAGIPEFPEFPGPAQPAQGFPGPAQPAQGFPGPAQPAQEFPGPAAPRPGLTPATQAENLRRAFDTVRRAGGGTHLVSKRIANNLRIPLLAEAFPEARWISITRDGRAVASSLDRVDWWEDSHVWWYGGTPRQWAAEGGDPWEICARNWVEEMREIEAGLAVVAPAQVLELSYESFVSAPVETLEKVADFAGFSPSWRWRSRLEGLRFPNQNDGWRKHLPAPAVATIERIQGETLRRYGYDCP